MHRLLAHAVFVSLIASFLAIIPFWIPVPEPVPVSGAAFLIVIISYAMLVLGRKS